MRRTRQVLAEEAAVRSGWGLSPWHWGQQVPGQAEARLGQSWRQTQLQLSSGSGWGSRAELKCSLGSLGCGWWSQGGLGRAVLGIQDPGRTNSPGQRAGLQCTAGGLSSEALPHHPGDLGVAPSCANPLQSLWCVRSCRISAGRAQDHPVQLWAIASVWHRVWLLLAKWNFFPS